MKNEILNLKLKVQQNRDNLEAIILKKNDQIKNKIIKDNNLIQELTKNSKINRLGIDQ